MNYQMLHDLVKKKPLPQFAKNENGENIIINHGIDNNVHFYRIQTCQKNGWIRHNFYYANGSTEELLEHL